MASGGVVLHGITLGVVLLSWLYLLVVSVNVGIGGETGCPLAVGEGCAGGEVGVGLCPEGEQCLPDGVGVGAEGIYYLDAVLLNQGGNPAVTGYSGVEQQHLKGSGHKLVCGEIMRHTIFCFEWRYLITITGTLTFSKSRLICSLTAV